MMNAEGKSLFLWIRYICKQHCMKGKSITLLTHDKTAVTCVVKVILPKVFHNRTTQDALLCLFFFFNSSTKSINIKAERQCNKKLL